MLVQGTCFSNNNNNISIFVGTFGSLKLMNERGEQVAQAEATPVRKRNAGFEMGVR